MQRGVSRAADGHPRAQMAVTRRPELHFQPNSGTTKQGNTAGISFRPTLPKMHEDTQYIQLVKVIFFFLFFAHSEEAKCTVFTLFVSLGHKRVRSYFSSQPRAQRAESVLGAIFTVRNLRNSHAQRAIKYLVYDFGKETRFSRNRVPSHFFGHRFPLASFLRIEGTYSSFTNLHIVLPFLHPKKRVVRKELSVHGAVSS